MMTSRGKTITMAFEEKKATVRSNTSQRLGDINLKRVYSGKKTKGKAYKKIKRITSY